jgi:hypothetical protein
MRGADRVVVAAQAPPAEYTLERVPDRPSSTGIWKKDTRLFGYKNADRPIQLCAEEGRQAGSPQVVQRNRLLSDTCEIGVGDVKGLVWDVCMHW